MVKILSGESAGLGQKAVDETLINKLDNLSKSAAHDLLSDGILMSVFNDNSFYSLGAYPSRSPHLNDRQHNAEDTVCMHTVRKKTVLKVEDARKDETLRNSKYVLEGHIVGYLGVPIVNPHFGTIGSICSITRTPRKWKILELGYLQQVANNVELLLLQEMGRIELKTFSETLSDVDQIIATLSASTTSPISIHEPNGELVFANNALLNEVPERQVAEFWCAQEHQGMLQRRIGESSGQERNLGDRKVVVQTTSGKIQHYRTSCLLSSSGLVLCNWLRCLSIVG